jgi:putative colanic acid biosynthesis UDP-glucose lipid carrier transferase
MKKYTTGNELIRGGVIIGDFIIMNLLLLAFFNFLPDIQPPYFKHEPRIVYIMANLSMVVAQMCVETIIHKRRIKLEELFVCVFKLCVLQLAIMIFILRLLCDGGGFFEYAMAFGPAEFILILLARVVEKYMIARFRLAGKNTRSIIFIGNDPSLLELYEKLMSDSSTGYKVRGYYADKTIESGSEKIPFLGNIDDLNKMMEGYSLTAIEKDTIHKKRRLRELNISPLDEVFCSLSHSDYDEIIKIMKFCDQNVVHFYYVPRTFGNYQLNLRPERLGDSIVFTNYYEPLARPFSKAAKRLFDILLSSVACFLLLFLAPIIIWKIKKESPGPGIFKQDRTGLNGETFVCYKFRSMHVNKESDSKQATKDDPRKFPFGDFIRRTNIDELPQFYNVLKGDMSIVGPRPHMLKHTEEYGRIIDQYMVRHFSRPGITGYAQIMGCRGETKDVKEMEERIKKDIWYIEHWSFWLDIKIILKTAISIFKHDEKAY